MSAMTVAAIDIGSSSGRVATVGFDGGRLSLNVAHRFAHTPVSQAGILRWDFEKLWNGVQTGLSILDSESEPIASIGADSFGVDYVLLDDNGVLLDTPTCHRDPRNMGAMSDAVAMLGAEDLYLSSGVQITPINSIFSLFADVNDRAELVSRAEKLLMVPDYIHHLLSGSTATEYTIASTTAALDMSTGDWSKDLLDKLGLPTRLFSEVVQPGTEVGALSGYSGALRHTRVILPAAHDTASAIVAVPLRQPHSLFISSGTWSLVGVETRKAIINAESRVGNLTNEGGYDGTVDLLRNVTGLWILQECQRQWAKEGQYFSYQELAELADRSPGLVSVINSTSHEFLTPGEMPRRIQEYCARMGEPIPHSVAEIARTVVDSLALSYRYVAGLISEATGMQPPAVHIVGGGSAHVLLSQLTADSTGCPTFCGPEEATTLGNAAVQLAALGELSSLSEIREVVAASTVTRDYAPRSLHDWEAASERVARMIAIEEALSIDTTSRKNTQ